MLSEGGGAGWKTTQKRRDFSWTRTCRRTSRGLTLEIRIIDGTTSPSGRLALAWGIPNVPRLDRLTDEQVVDNRDKVRNYLIEKKTHAIVAAIPRHTRRCRFIGKYRVYKGGGDYWTYPPNLDSRESIHTCWSRDEDWVLISQGNDWWYEAIYLGHRAATGFHFIEIGDRVEDAIRSELRRRHPRAYNEVRVHLDDRRMPCIYLGNARLLPPVILLEVSCGVRNEDSPLDFEGRVDLRFMSEGQSIHAGITSLQLKPPGKK